MQHFLINWSSCFFSTSSLWFALFMLESANCNRMATKGIIHAHQSQHTGYAEICRGTSSDASSSSFPMIFPEVPITTVTSHPNRWKVWANSLGFQWRPCLWKGAGPTVMDKWWTWMRHLSLLWRKKSLQVVSPHLPISSHTRHWSFVRSQLWCSNTSMSCHVLMIISRMPQEQVKTLVQPTAKIAHFIPFHLLSLGPWMPLIPCRPSAKRPSQ